MKIIKDILVVIGLFLGVGISFAVFSHDSAKQGQGILDNLSRYESKPESKFEWKPTGPTREDILAATKVKNLAAKGSREDKLINAVVNGDSKAVKAHIAAGADLEARDSENNTALMIAAKEGYIDIVSKLINAGANVNATDRFGCTALFKAADKNHVDIVKMLIAKGAAADSTFEEAFVSSVYKGNTEMVKALSVLLIAENVISGCILEEAMSVVNFRNTELVALLKNLLKKSQ